MTAPLGSKAVRLWRGILVAATLYGVATIVLTWPLFRHPGTTVLDSESLYGPSSVLVQRDINLTMWVLAWDAHAIATDPLHLFDANAFYPAKLSLACSEHMLGNLPLFAPAYALTQNPVLGHQVALVLTFVFCGLAMAAYVLYWTGDGAAAVAAGFVFAFAPNRFWQLGNLHVISVQYLPMVLLGIDGVLDRRRPTLAALALTGALVMSTLCSYYIGYAAFIVAAAYALGGLVMRGRTALPRAVPLLVCGVVAALFLGLVTLPYVLLRRSGVLPDYTDANYVEFAFLVILKFGVSGLLSWFVLPSMEGIPQYLTWTAIVFAAIAVLYRRRRPNGALIATAITGLVLALGPDVPLPWQPTTIIKMPYRLLATIVPGFSTMRAPLRFGSIVTLSVAALAGLGIATARSRLRAGGRERAATLLPVVLVATLCLEATPRRLSAMPMAVGPGMPAAVRWLAEHGEGAPLLSLPIGNLYHESRYMYLSTGHWLPTANGYSSYPPKTFIALAEQARKLPDPTALPDVVAQIPGLRWVLYDRMGIPPAVRPQWEKTLGDGLRLVQDFGDNVLYEVRR